MKNALTLAGRTSALTLLSLSATQAFAGDSFGSVTHSPDIAGVPLLGGAGLVVLSALLGLVSLRFLKDRSRHGSTFVIAATLTGAIVAAGGGIKLISDAQAAPSVQLTKTGGGTVTLPFEGLNIVFNDTNVPQQIKDISADEPCFIASGGILNGGFINGGMGNGGVMVNGGNGGYQGICSDEGHNGTVLQPNASCDVFVCCPNGGGNGGTQGGNGGCFGPT